MTMETFLDRVLLSVRAAMNHDLLVLQRERSTRLTHRLAV